MLLAEILSDTNNLSLTANKILSILSIHVNYQEKAMKFGLFHSVQLPDPARQNEYYRDALEQVLWAEQLGYDSVWMTEHHFSRHGIVSASLSVLAYLAGLTSRIRLATAVTVLPFHNPIQIAEEAATVDVLSNGRLDLGVGRGYQWGEFHKFNIPMAEADRRFQEAIGVLTRAWTETEPFDHRGEFWTFNDMTVQPKPVQAPYPPLWVAAASPASMDRIAAHGWNLLVGQGLTFDQVAEQVAYFRGAVGEAGGDYDPDRVLGRSAPAPRPRGRSAARGRSRPERSPSPRRPGRRRPPTPTPRSRGFRRASLAGSRAARR